MVAAKFLSDSLNLICRRRRPVVRLETYRREGNLLLKLIDQQLKHFHLSGNGLLQRLR
ncbi:hypothetical protein D3C84_1192470 [compost metagenome]